MDAKNEILFAPFASPLRTLRLLFQELLKGLNRKGREDHKIDIDAKHAKE